ncbi:hypothetical protein JCM17844_18500 [Iodidimonas gelatinilytica]|uniref:HAD family hydrolase n=1 Tax=Iodidimonas gelatinilytica TaxID=1236966 RepID=A0A5A7MSK9_9PROT|nr:hypothetical protein [Iodidimonas gelatinilytica]GEQ98213.1 hypothetical protein JCM17844_18500 [Iodidimonas gelatinilytica]
MTTDPLQDLNRVPPIERLVHDPHKPLIICDADEVLLEFAKPLELWLNDRELYLELKSFALEGNIRRLDDKSPLSKEEVRTLVDDFLDHVVDRAKPTLGATSAVRRLRESCSMVVLTNIPHHLRHRRQLAMKAAGIDLPVLSNVGEKGPMVAKLIHNHKGPVLFVDDMPGHHSSVAKYANHAHRIHFVADMRLARMIDPAPDSHHRIDRWDACVDYIETHLTFSGQ